MIKIGTPADPDKYFCADEGWLIFELHQAGCMPEWRDFEATYFKKNSKLKKVLKKLNINIDE